MLKIQKGYGPPLQTPMVMARTEKGRENAVNVLYLRPMGVFGLVFYPLLTFLEIFLSMP